MTAADPLAALRARVQELETQLAALDTEVLVLRDQRDSARAEVVAEQRSHQAYRLRNPQKRTAS